MKDPQSLTLEEIEEFLLEPEGGKEEYNFTPQTGGSNGEEEEEGVAAPVRDPEEATEGDFKLEEVAAEVADEPKAANNGEEGAAETNNSEEADLGDLNSESEEGEPEPEAVNSEEADLGNLDFVNENDNVEYEEGEAEEAEAEEGEAEEAAAPENGVVLEPEDEEAERAAGEYLIEMNDFEFLDSDAPVFIREEIQLPEYKVITTEEEQIADLTNELMKSIPEEKRDDKRVLRSVKRKVEAFIKLKSSCSTFENGEVSGSKLLGNLHREIIGDIMSGNLSNKLYRPIVHQRKTLYQNETTDADGATSMIFTVENDENKLISNTDTITSQSSLRRRYKNDTRLRHNYSYISEIGELNRSFEDYNEMGTSGYNVNLNKPTEVYNAAFPENDLATISKCLPETRKLDTHIANGDISLNLEGNPLAGGNNIKIVGVVKIPDENTKLSSFIQEPLRHSVNENYLDFSVREKLLTESAQLVNLEKEIGTRVKLCVPDPKDITKTINVKGTIIDIDTENDKYVVELAEQVRDLNRILGIKRGDKSIKLDRSDLLNDTGDLRECYHTSSALFRFPNMPLNSETMEELLEEIIPKSADVIRQHFKEIQLCENLNQVNRVLNKYDINTNNLTTDLITPIRLSIEARNEETLNKSRAERAKLQDLLRAEPVIQKQVVDLLNRKLLEEFREYYGEYPHYNTSIDNTAERLRWLYSQYDQGTLFFKTIILKRFGSFFRNIATSRTAIEKELDKLEAREIKLRRDIDTALDKAAREGGECPARKLVKVYTTLADLQADDLHDIEIDVDKRPLIDPSEGRGIDRDYNRDEGMESRDMYLVKPGDYCLLDEPGSPKAVYKRANITGGDMWIKEEGLNLDTIVSSSSDFCNQFNLNIAELTEQLKSRREGCFYNTKRSVCLPASVEKLDTELSSVLAKKNERARMTALVRDSANYKEYLEALIKSLRKTLTLYRKLQENAYKYAEREYEKVAETEPDEYDEFYKKVNKYLTSINSLPGEERSKMLIPFLDKYGRDFDPTEGENPRNIYSKIGNRVLMCGHNRVLINFYTDSSNAENTFKYLRNNWCAESEGKLYCKNCGQEVFDADYETVEGFASNGAHMVSTEVMEPDEEAASALAEVKYIEQLLEREEDREDAKFVEDTCKTLTKIMGIRLRDADKNGILRKTLEVNSVNIKTLDNWMASQKKLPKNQAVIDKAFSGYRNRNMIINTSSVAFIFLQSNTFGYSIKNPHSKCKASLRGFPLDTDEKNDSGIKYITCLLETLRDSGSDIYNSLKKAKVEDGIRRVISYCLRDPYIKDILANKRDTVDVDVASGKNVRRDWGEFKPPMMKFDVPYSNTEVMDPQNPDYDEHNNLLGMKVIQNINSVIDKSSVENRMFDPVPLGNTCCAEKLDNKYDYRNYFLESGDVVPLVETLNTMDSTKPQKDLPTRIIMDRVVIRERPDRFDKLVSPDTEDEETRKLVFVNNITSGRFIGKPHIFDEYGICVLTGASKKELSSKTVSLEEYNEFTEALSKAKLYPSIKNETVYNVVNVLNELRFSNSVLRNNDFIGNTIEKLSQFKSGDEFEDLEEIWDDLERQITIEKDTLVGMVSQATNKRQTGKFTEQLESLGKLVNIKDDNSKKMGDETAEMLFDERREKLLQNYFHKLRVMINRIKNRNLLEEDTVRTLIPSGWKKSASDAILGRLVSSSIKSNSTVHKNIELINSNRQLERLVSNLSKFVDKNTVGLKSILGKSSIVNCNNTLKLVSVLSTKNSADLLYYTMIITFIEMLKTIETSTTLGELMGDSKAPKTFAEFMDVPEVDESGLAGLDEEEEEVEGAASASANEAEMGDVSVAIKDSKKFTAELIIDFLSDMKREQDLLDKYTNSYIQKSITRDAEEQKEENLKFMEMLETEARQSLKAMLTIGVDSWKNLASKNKSLYFEIPEDQREVDEPVADVVETDMRVLAARDLGEDFTEAQFADWQAQTTRGEMIEREALREHVMPGDDGEGLEYNSDNDYVNDY